MTADLRAAILAIQRDTTLSEAEKAVKRQQLLTGSFATKTNDVDAKNEKKKKKNDDDDDDDSLGENLKCVICFDVCSMPVTAVCQHNFCLACLKRWTNSGKKNCPTCRANFSRDFITNPRINTTLVALIRATRKGPDELERRAVLSFKQREKARLKENESRPEEAFRTERAAKTGLANASSGRLMVSCPTDMFGPIGPEYDLGSKRGLHVGDSWPNRLVCRQYGAHFPHVAGIAGQSHRGAQSVVLSGGYIDDIDMGTWFVYTGSGGRDLSGNKRTSNKQDFDQVFTKYNAALKVSCEQGLPLRVVRSHKEKRSSFAPRAQDEKGEVIASVRYDGIYRVEKVWRKPGEDGHLVCRYLMVRCDNSPAPWDSGDCGDRPDAGSENGFRVEELKMDYQLSMKTEGKTGERKVPKGIQDYFERDGDVTPAWDWIPGEQRWGWTRDPPACGGQTATERKEISASEQLIKKFGCDISKGKDKHVLVDPVSTPCGHSFCRECLTNLFKGVGNELNRQSASGRSLRTKKIIKSCPVCKFDITECVNNMQVNREAAAVIEKLKQKVREKEGKNENPDGDSGSKNGLVCPKVAGTKKEEEKPKSATPVKKAKTKFELALESLVKDYPDVDKGLIETLLADQDGDVKDVRFMLRSMTSQPEKKKQRR